MSEVALITPRAPALNMRPMGVVTSQPISTMPSLYEKNINLLGQNRYRVYSEMLANTAIVAAGVRYFLNLVSKSDWKAIPAKEADEESVFYADQIQKAMHGMKTSWYKVVRRAAMYRFYGFSLQEWVMKFDETDNRLITYDDIGVRPNVTIDSWDYDEKGTVYGVVQWNAVTGGYAYIPRDKLIYMVDDTLNETPEGLGLFRHVYPLAKNLEFYEQLEGYGLESDLRGIPIYRAPIDEVIEKINTGDEQTKQQAELELSKVQEFLDGHRRTSEMAFYFDSAVYEDEEGKPSNVYKYSMELLKGSSTAHASVFEVITRINKQIAVLLGVETLLLGTDSKGSSGSFALSENKTENFFLIVDSTLSDLRDQFQKDFVQPLFKINRWDMSKMPRLAPEAIQFNDPETIANTIYKLAQAGAPLAPDDPIIQHVRELLDLPNAKTMEEDMLL